MEKAGGMGEKKKGGRKKKSVLIYFKKRKKQNREGGKKKKKKKTFSSPPFYLFSQVPLFKKMAADLCESDGMEAHSAPSGVDREPSPARPSQSPVLGAEGGGRLSPEVSTPETSNPDVRVEGGEKVARKRVPSHETQSANAPPRSGRALSNEM
eukprot:TRINITY_DN822_c0_g1_i18.p1 TRINITY_DN822_c0_g1~~TRINITY_DN822_c0_g1_i18.p1  ORF type:complete len:153 (+),score=29.43 TRINITY_DN822_c0_g1_i18:1002-1460(+)